MHTFPVSVTEIGRHVKMDSVTPVIVPVFNLEFLLLSFWSRYHIYRLRNQEPIQVE